MDGIRFEDHFRRGAVPGTRRIRPGRSWRSFNCESSTDRAPPVGDSRWLVGLVEVVPVGRADVDIVDQPTRSRMMGLISGKNTKPELAVRKVAHRLGYRFRLHRRDLAGSPDLVFPRRRKVIFVHGCYWHRHPGCRYAYSPKSNVDFWNDKFEANKARDAAALTKLKDAGWDPLVIWECDSADSERVATLLSAHLGAP